MAQQRTTFDLAMLVYTNAGMDRFISGKDKAKDILARMFDRLADYQQGCKLDETQKFIIDDRRMSATIFRGRYDTLYISEVWESRKSTCDLDGILLNREDVGGSAMSGYWLLHFAPTRTFLLYDSRDHTNSVIDDLGSVIDRLPESVFRAISSPRLDITRRCVSCNDSPTSIVTDEALSQMISWNPARMEKVVRYELHQQVRRVRDHGVKKTNAVDDHVILFLGNDSTSVEKSFTIPAILLIGSTTGYGWHHLKSICVRYNVALPARSILHKGIILGENQRQTTIQLPFGGITPRVIAIMLDLVADGAADENGYDSYDDECEDQNRAMLGLTDDEFWTYNLIIQELGLRLC